MVSVLPPTVACTVRTVTAPGWLAAVSLLACEVVAAAAVIPPPMAAAAARLTLAMMILGCRMVLAPCGIDCALSTNTVSRDAGFTRQAGYSCGAAAGGGGARRVWPRLAVGPAGGRDVWRLGGVGPWGGASAWPGGGCGGAPPRGAR